MEKRRRKPKDKAYNQCALFSIFFDFFQGAIDIFVGIFERFKGLQSRTENHMPHRISLCPVRSGDLLSPYACLFIMINIKFLLELQTTHPLPGNKSN
jgi:hypothetical protein